MITRKHGTSNFDFRAICYAKWTHNNDKRGLPSSTYATSSIYQSQCYIQKKFNIKHNLWGDSERVGNFSSSLSLAKTILKIAWMECGNLGLRKQIKLALGNGACDFL